VSSFDDQERTMPKKSTRYDEPLALEDLTPLNLSALARVIKEYGDADGVFYKIDATGVPHIKRAIRAGAVMPAGKPGHWRLSTAGRALLVERGLAGIRRRRR
jgi:hypothetical protein